MPKISTFRSLLLLIPALFFVFCKNEKTNTAAAEITVGQRSFDKTGGKDCDKPDSLRMDCVHIDLSWPSAESGSDAFKANVGKWADDYLIGILAPSVDSTSPAIGTVEAAAQAFLQMHQDYVKESGGSIMGGVWAAECEGEVLLNDGKHFTAQITGFTYAGGAHGSPTAAVATFETATGKKLTWDDLVTDKAALLALAEKHFREEQQEAFKEGFKFDDIFKFALPANFGLVKDGIYCHYLHYEVGPYAMGNTTFTIPFSALQGLLKQ